MPKDITRTEFFECACHSDEHTLKFTLDGYEGADYKDIEVYTSVFLNQYHNFWGRLWIAVKYLFGYKCKYGHFDCFILREDDAARLQSLLNQYKDRLADANAKQSAKDVLQRTLSEPSSAKDRAAWGSEDEIR